MPHYSSELSELLIHPSTSLGNNCGTGLLRLWDNGGRNIKLGQVEFIDMVPLSGNSRFNVEASTVCFLDI